MPAVLTPSALPAERATGDGGFAALPPDDPGGWQRPPGGNRIVQRYKLGVWIGMGGILMFFAALTSAMIVRQGLSNDWQPFSLPPVLYVSTLVLLLSSVTIERAKQALEDGSGDGLRKWVNVSAILGAVFVAFQLLGWQSLTARGIYLASNPASSFYYVLTAGHGLHLLGGIAVMGYIWVRLRTSRPWPTRRAVVEATALYWHFLDALWIYILGLLLIWR